MTEPRHLRLSIAYLTATRLALNTAWRFTYPFLPAISRGLGISLSQAGLLLSSRSVAGLATPYFREIVIYDPTPVLNRLTVPVLGFYGNLDVQVPAAQNVGRLSGALRVAGNPDYRVEMFDGLNHLMQPARTGAVSEYGEIETTIAPEVLELVVTWLQERFLR